MMYFELYMVYMYSNLEFTDEEKLNEAFLYDTLKSNGVVNAILTAIPTQEFQKILEILDKTKYDKMNFRNTLAYVLNNFIENLPENAIDAKEILDKFNPEDFTHAMEFFKAIK